jgi:glycyl-tRNA synthetase
MIADIVAFVAERLRGLMRDRGLPADVIEAALAARDADPSGAFRSATALAGATREADWPPVLQAYARCKRLVKDQAEAFAVEPGRYTEPATRGLYEAWQASASGWGVAPRWKMSYIPCGRCRRPSADSSRT